MDTESVAEGENGGVAVVVEHDEVYFAISWMIVEYLGESIHVCAVHCCLWQC